MEQEVTVETTEVKPQNYGRDDADVGEFFGPVTVGHLDLPSLRISFPVPVFYPSAPPSAAPAPTARKCRDGRGETGCR